ncbi:unnamed protein product [Protopolystoma xenopodis]|uniref:SRCR domain-containing protein n=1 Tax=Protopolystoma xenopodis TaxID=117903 RepID=A0A3S5FH74_9PLAT|nr:unnamed protein product [Protopolystoma xenopodis]
MLSSHHLVLPLLAAHVEIGIDAQTQRFSSGVSLVPARSSYVSSESIDMWYMCSAYRFVDDEQDRQTSGVQVVMVELVCGNRHETVVGWRMSWRLGVYEVKLRGKWATIC